MLAQGATAVNGPHQGALGRDAAAARTGSCTSRTGRVRPHRPPAADAVEGRLAGDRRRSGRRRARRAGAGWRAAPSRAASAPPCPRPSDDFDGEHARPAVAVAGNPRRTWASLTRGGVRSACAAVAARANLWSATNLLLQKLPAPGVHGAPRASTRAACAPASAAGLRGDGHRLRDARGRAHRRGLTLLRATARGADKGGAETEDGAASRSTAVRSSCASRSRRRPSRASRYSARRRRLPAARPRVRGPPGPLDRREGRPRSRARLPWRPRPATWTSTPSRSCPTAPRPKGLVVAQDGSGDFRTIQEALDADPAPATRRTASILMRNGVYREKVTVDAGPRLAGGRGPRARRASSSRSCAATGARRIPTTGAPR